MLAAFALPSLARADRVVLYPVDGRADQERLDEIHGVLSGILREQGHTLVPPPTAERPDSSAGMENVAGATNRFLNRHVLSIVTGYSFADHGWAAADAVRRLGR